MSMKADKLVMELEDVVLQLGYRIRKEKGNFRGGSCILEGEQLIMLNKNQPLDTQAVMLAKLIQSLEHTSVFIKPAVRKELDEIWARLNAIAEPELNFDAS